MIGLAIVFLRDSMETERLTSLLKPKTVQFVESSEKKARL